MCANNLPKVATQWNSGTTRDSNGGRRVLIPSALTTRPLSHTLCMDDVVQSTDVDSPQGSTVDTISVGAGDWSTVDTISVGAGDWSNGESGNVAETEQGTTTRSG